MIPFVVVITLVAVVASAVTILVGGVLHSVAETFLCVRFRKTEPIIFITTCIPSTILPESTVMWHLQQEASIAFATPSTPECNAVRIDG